MGRVQKDNEGVRTVSQKIRCATPHDDASSGFRSLGNGLLHERDHPVRVQNFRTFERESALVTATPENFAEAIEQGIDLFLATDTFGRIHTGEPGDLMAQLAVEQPPSETFSGLLSHFGGAAAIFPLDNQDLFWHGLLRIGP